MNRILLISDTHGRLDSINELVSRTEAQMVIHAGDFGFYDEGSIKRLSNRELKLLIVHSPYKALLPKKLRREELVKVVLEHNLLGNFNEYLLGKKHFSVPVYALWGNHDDVGVIKELRKGNSIDNFFLLDENHCYEMPSFQLAGIGGNFLNGKKLFGPPLSGEGGKVWSTLHQYGALYQRLNQVKKPLIFVSHVSPGKEPLLTRLMMQFKIDFWISGHMGAPYTCVWNQFTVREEEDVFDWVNQEELSEGSALTEEVKLAIELIHRPLPKDCCLRQPWNINLPDCEQGHALLVIEEDRFALETFSRGIKIVRDRLDTCQTI